MTDKSRFAVIIPAKNEEKSIGKVVGEIKRLHVSVQVIVVDDCSDDDTRSVALAHGAKVISHPYSKGNGAAIKTGLRNAEEDIIICMDGDGQHQPEEISLLINKLNEGYDMVVGARDRSGQAGVHRSFANGFYNWFATWMVGHKVEDLTSGFRAVRRHKFLEFISLLPNKFSYPTTITMSFFRAGYSVAYMPINVQRRLAGTQSHVRIWKDGIRFLLIIFKIGTLFSPLKLFAPISLALFLSGSGYYLYTYLTDGRFTNMALLLFTTSIIVFLMGLISEQITALIYKDRG
jgi:glycosyltransferase involved in cell wall biosynthesis